MELGTSRLMRKERPLARKFRTTVQVAFAVLTLAIGLLALPPEQWLQNLGSWTDPFVRHRDALMTALVAILILSLAALQASRWLPFTSFRHVDIKRPLSHEQDGEGPPKSKFPVKADRILRRLLFRLGQSDPGHPHVVRIWLATGDTIVSKGYLEYFFDVLNPRAHFQVRILMMDPDSPMIKVCGHEDWADQVRLTCKQLEEIDQRYRDKKEGTLEWRAYQYPPMIRAVLINEQYLLFGFMKWFREREGIQLHNQNDSYIYLTRRTPGAAEFIDFVKNWFDHEWDQHRRISSG